MNNVYSEKEIQVEGHLPQLDKLGAKAKLFLKSINLEELRQEYQSSSDYSDFFAKINKNPMTRDYLNFSNSGDVWLLEGEKISPFFSVWWWW